MDNISIEYEEVNTFIGKYIKQLKTILKANSNLETYIERQKKEIKITEKDIINKVEEYLIEKHLKQQEKKKNL